MRTLQADGLVDETQKFTLVSFADKRMLPTLHRLANQIEGLDAVKQKIFFTEDDLPDKFKRQAGPLLRGGVRGFGYWVWKPEVILLALEQIGFDEILCYCDAGFHVNRGGASHLSRYLGPLVQQETGLVSFSHDISLADFHGDATKMPDLSEFRYTKGDMLDHWGVRQDSLSTHTPQFASGLFFLRKSQENLDYLKQWKEVALSKPQLFDDSPSISPNIPGFIENRHDQSYFSLMCKSMNHRAFSAFEFWHPNAEFKADWDAIAEYPFHARRDKEFRGHRRYWQPLFSALQRAKKSLFS